MILYKDASNSSLPKRATKNVVISAEEKPERPQYAFRSNNERRKYVDMVKAYVRASQEYKDYIKFLKDHVDMNKCIVFNKLRPGVDKKYSIELHHDPFSLFDICNIVLSKRQALGESINPYKVAEEVTELHYDGKVGLINLSVTCHELCEKGKIFIPLQWIYQRFDKFYSEYEEYIDEVTASKIELKVKMSMACDQIQSDVLDTEFVYIDIDGFKFPEVPEEWGKLLKLSDPETVLASSN
jgi:hypothetical protein